MYNSIILQHKLINKNYVNEYSKGLFTNISNKDYNIWSLYLNELTNICRRYGNDYTCVEIYEDKFSIAYLGSVELIKRMFNKSNKLFCVYSVINDFNEFNYQKNKEDYSIVDNFIKEYIKNNIN